MREPIEEYRARQADRAAATAEHEKQDDRFANLRLAVAAVAAAVLWAVLGAPGAAPEWLLLPIGAFVVLVVLHARVIRKRDALRRAERFYDDGIARLAGEWAGRGRSGERYFDAAHPYAGDLDVFGKGSLFERISTARTRAGEDALAKWLLAPAAPDEIRARQEAVRELAPRLDFREEVALLGADAPVTIAAEDLERWGTAPPAGLPRWLGPAAAVAGAGGVAALVAWFSGATPAYLAGAVLLEALLVFPFRGRIAGVLSFADRPASELKLLARILSRFEAERFSSPRLSGLTARLSTGGEPPSRRIRRLVGLQNFVDSGRNPLFAPLTWLALLPVHLAIAMERWRAKSGGAVADWLRAGGELEALLSLAGYSYENPEDAFAEILPGAEPHFTAKGAAHPLLPRSRAVANDVSLGGELRLLVISGSNMSGKSTMLRTVGANAVLAQCGAPARAASLSLSTLHVGASIQLHDSLLEGASRFYAEITRLKQVVDLAADGRPVLFLLDELLHGTNSHDRATGAEGIVTGLLERRAIGLVTTHDLALGRIAESLAPRAKNVHFEDRMEGDRMVFDYRLREGVVTRSNALDLMRAIGLLEGE